MRLLAAVALSFSVLVALAAGVGIGAFSASASPQDRPQWDDPDLGPSIAEGVATERYIWLLGWNGGLVWFDRHNGERLLLGTRVQDILADAPHLWAVSILPDGSTFEVRDLRGAAAPLRGGEVSVDPLHLIRMPDGIAILTSDAIFLPTSDGLSRQALANPLDGWFLAAASRSGSVYAGGNFGEFGGRLSRLDPRTGEANRIVGMSAADHDDLCEGDFNPDCDPIVGVLPDPQHPDCVIAASGAFHMGMTHGKVYRVCGDDLTLTYQTPNRTPLLGRLLAPTDYWRDLSAPIESLTETRDGWIAVSTGRYFRMRGDQVSEHRMPDFHPWSGLYLSEEQDGVLFAVAACCNGPAFAPEYWTIAIPVMP